MPLVRRETKLAGLSIVEPLRFPDSRGYFWEVFNADKWKAELGLDLDIVQFNQSGSVKDVVRGLHFQFDPPMGKLMRVTKGVGFLVAVDIRVNSPTLGQWVGVEASEENNIQIWGEAGFARGFCALSDYLELQYLCTGAYNGKGESSFKWNDAEVGVKWPIEKPIVSERDDNAQSFRDWLDKPEAQKFRI